MRRGTLTVGVFMILFAILLFEQGTQVLGPMADLAGLSSHYVEESVILPPTLYSVPAANYTFVSEELPSGHLLGSLQVADGREVAFYVFDEGNFSLWRAGRPSMLALVEPVAISYNFTLSPTSSGTYYFVFDNQDNSLRRVVFSLSSARSVTVLNPLLQYADFELLLIGTVLSYLGLRGGGKKPKPSPTVETGWKCKFCSALNEEERAFCVNCGRSQS